MPIKEGITLVDIHDVVQRVRDVQHFPLSPQPIYNARRTAAVKAGELWTPNEKLSAEHPVRYTSDQATQIIEALHQSFAGASRDTGVYVENKIREGHICDTQELLSDPTHPLPSDQPDMFIQVPEGAPLKDKHIPFRIRAHHLVQYAELVGTARLSYPEHLASDFVLRMDTQRQKIRMNPEQYPEEAAWYYTDVLGDVRADKDAVQESFNQEFAKFKTLPADHPIDLLAGQQDGICKGCKTGEHCKLRNFQLRPHGMVEHDANFLSIFLHEAVRQKNASDIQVTRATVSFSDAPDETIEGLRTTAGTVKSVLANSFMNWKNLAEPAIKRIA